MKFLDKLNKIVKENNSLLCIGLDPEVEKISGGSVFSFNKFIIEKTNHFACAYKPNIAFYEALGLKGLEELKKTIEFLKSDFPHIPIILDAKRADVPNTAKMYAKALYDFWEADASTIYPQLGLDSCIPFLEYSGKTTFLIIKTSNPDSGSLQNIPSPTKPFYLTIAAEISKWNYENIGIFCGATYPDELSRLRKIFPDKIFLSAGIGAQGADTQKAVSAGLDKSAAGIIFNASRSIIYNQDPGAAAQNLRDEINKYRHIQ